MKKMKKLVSLLLALVMCALLVACGGNDSGSDATNDDAGNVADNADDAGSTAGPTDEQLQALTEAYNQVAVLYNDVVTTAQGNGWTADEQTSNTIQTMGIILDPVGQALSGDMSLLEGADFDTLPDTVLEILPDLETLSEKVAVPYEGGESGADVVTDEALKPLAEAYNEIAPLFNDIYTTAETNGWLNDEQTSAELDALTGMLSYIGSGLTDDPSKLEDADIDGLIEQLQQFGPALDELAQRVSVPYGDEG